MLQCAAGVYGQESAMGTVLGGASGRLCHVAYSQQRRRTLWRGGGGVGSLAAVGLLAACVPAGYANYSPAAGRPAAPAEALAVSTAVHSSPLTAGAGTRPYRVEAIRLSTGTPGYAFATIDPTSQQLDGAAVALRATPNTGGHLSWRVFDVGSRHVGCSAPLAVRSEFALHC